MNNTGIGPVPALFTCNNFFLNINNKILIVSFSESKTTHSGTGQASHFKLLLLSKPTIWLDLFKSSTDKRTVCRRNKTGRPLFHLICHLYSKPSVANYEFFFIRKKLILINPGHSHFFHSFIHSFIHSLIDSLFLPREHIS